MAIFDPENDLWQFFGRAGDVLGLSACWLVCSLPLVTVGAASTALYDGVVHGVRRKETGVYLRFFRTFKESFKPATLVTLIYLIPFELLLLMTFVSRMYAQAGSAAAGTIYYAGLVLLCLPAAAWVMAMAALSRFAFGVKDLAVTGAKLMAAHLPVAFPLGALTVFGAYLTVWLFPLCVPLLFFVPGIFALLASLLLERVLKKYEPEKEEEPERSDETNDES